MKRSRLSDIPGLGPKRVRDLLAHFRSIDAIQLASPEAIAQAPGMGPALARQVWEYFHPPVSESDYGPAAAVLPDNDLPSSERHRSEPEGSDPQQGASQRGELQESRP